MTTARDSISIESSQVDGEVVLTVAGEVDIASAPRLDARLDRVNNGDRVVIDCAGITFIGSAGLSIVLFHRRRLAESGGQLSLRNPSYTVRRVLDVSGLTGLLDGDDH
jgi:anti-anti-sigma factor